MRCAGWLGALGVAGSVLAVSTARAQQGSDQEAQVEARERAALLAQALPEAVRRRSLPALPPLLIAAGAATAALGIGERSPAIAAGGAAMLAGAVGFYLVPEQQDYELLAATAGTGMGLLYLGLPLPSPHERWQIPLGGAHLAMSALGFINFAYSPHPGRTRLRVALARVNTPAARKSLSLAELRQIERDLYDTDPTVPQWALGLPLILGGIAASAPLLDRDIASREKPLMGVLAGLALLQGLTISLTPTAAGQYRDSLRRAGLALHWSATPGRISLMGSFD